MGKPEGVGARIRQAREELGLTQEGLAEILGVQVPTVSRWETGVYTPKRVPLPKIAECLKKPVSWFYGVDSGDSELDAIKTRLEALEKRLPSDLLQKKDEKLQEM